MRTQNSAIPLPHKNITAVHKAVRNAHIAQPFLRVLQFLQQFEIAGGYYYFAAGESLHLSFHCCIGWIASVLFFMIFFCEM